MSTFATAQAELAEKLRELTSERIEAENVARAAMGAARTRASAAEAEAKAAFAATAIETEAALAAPAISELATLFGEFDAQPSRKILRSIATRWGALNAETLDQCGDSPSNKVLAVAAGKAVGRLPDSFDRHSPGGFSWALAGDLSARLAYGLVRGDLAGAENALDSLIHLTQTAPALAPEGLLERLGSVLVEGSFRRERAAIAPAAPVVVAPPVAPSAPVEPTYDDAEGDEPGSAERDAIAAARALAS